MSRREVTIGSRVGLHARPAALFVQAATASGQPVKIGKPDGELVDARSMLSVLALGARNGETVVLELEGDGADAVLDQLADLLVQDLDEPVASNG
jgi:phosphocarrier protein HPr